MLWKKDPTLRVRLKDQWKACITHCAWLKDHWKACTVRYVRLENHWRACTARYARHKNKRTQRIPYWATETDALEAWLEEQASEGWQLKRFWSGWALFQKTTPQRLHFRMERLRYPLDEEGQQRIAVCKEASWDYIDTYNHWVVYQSESAEAEELPLNPDPAEEEKNMHGILVSLFVFALLVIFSAMSFIGLSRLDWIEYGFFKVPALFAGVILSVFCVLREKKIERALEARKEDGAFALRTFHTKQRAKRRVRVTFFSIVLLIAVLIVLVATPNSGSSGETPHFASLAGYEEALPIPLLADINPKEGASLDAIASQDLLQNMGWRDEMREDSRFFLPRHLWIWQAGTHVRKDGNQMRQLNYYNAFYYELRTEGLATWLFQDLARMNDYEVLPAAEDMQVLYERVEQEEAPPVQKLLLRHKTILYEIIYRGQSDLVTCLPMFEEAARAAVQG